MGIRDGKNLDPGWKPFGSGIRGTVNIQYPQHWNFPLIIFCCNLHVPQQNIPLFRKWKQVPKFFCRNMITCVNFSGNTQVPVVASSAYDSFEIASFSSSLKKIPQTLLLTCVRHWADPWLQQRPGCGPGFPGCGAGRSGPRASGAASCPSRSGTRVRLQQGAAFHFELWVMALKKFWVWAGKFLGTPDPDNINASTGFEFECRKNTKKWVTKFYSTFQLRYVISCMEGDHSTVCNDFRSTITYCKMFSAQ